MRLANKETKWLVIFAVIFIIVGLSLSIVIQKVTKETILKQYKNYFETAQTYELEDLKDEAPLQSKIIFKNKAKEVIGYAFTGGEKVEGIPGSTGLSELTISVIVDKDNKIIDVYIVVSEHTPSYIEKVESYFNTLPGTLLPDYKDVDEVTGASAYSMPVVRKVLDKVTLNLTGKDPNPPAPKLEPHELLFGEGSTVEVDSSFVPTELIIKKEIVKDATGNELGYAYSATGLSDQVLHPNYHNEKETITLMIGISKNGKVKGVVTVESNHTPDFYGKHEDKFAELKDIELDNLQLDLETGATISFNLINKLFNAIKEAEGL